MNLLNRCTIDKPKCTVLCKLNGGGSSSFLLVRLFCEITFFCKKLLQSTRLSAQKNHKPCFSKKEHKIAS